MWRSPENLQRNYYEHIIRNENSYQKIRQYILDNPRNWEQDENNLNKFKPM
jgi:REP element-mobilizing transposase RayT